MATSAQVHAILQIAEIIVRYKHLSTASHGVATRLCYTSFYMPFDSRRGGPVTHRILALCHSVAATAQREVSAASNRLGC
jgi:hypothetical protein